MFHYNMYERGWTVRGIISDLHDFSRSDFGLGGVEPGATGWV